MNPIFSYENLCGSCSHKSCCIDCNSPLLFSHDLNNLEQIQTDTTDFLETIQINDIHVMTIKKKENSSECSFWDDKNKKCSIYENRPFDCKMFPFDIIQKNNEYFWIVHSCNPQSNWTWTESLLESLESDPGFDDFIKNIHTYASFVLSTLNKKKSQYTIIRRVNIPNPVPIQTRLPYLKKRW